MKYGKLTFVKVDGKSKDNHIMWECVCDCGNKYIGYATRIKNGNRKQCKKCGYKDVAIKNSTHCMRYSSEYSSWRSMKERCLNKSSKDYENYGAKGITIYEKWINSFEDFFSYIGKKQYGQSIDRIDNTKGYYPENVRWANQSTQQRNKNNSLWLEWNGKKTHISDIAKELNISSSAAHLRYKRGKLYV